MHRYDIIEPIGFALSGAVFLLSFLLFYYNTSMFLGSLAAAILAAALTWATYIVLRWMLLAIRK